MLRRIGTYLLLISLVAIFASQRSGMAQGDSSAWNFSASASTLAQWISGIILAEEPDIETIVLSVRDDGVFLDAGDEDRARAGQVFEIYRTAHAGQPEQIVGKVQVVWTREDYCFAEPYGNINLADVSTLHFARLVHVAPALEIEADYSQGGDETKTENLLDTTSTLLGARGIRVFTRDSREQAWRLVVSPDTEGQSLNASLTSPAGETLGNIILNPQTGARMSSTAWLDAAYLSGEKNPFERHITPPGRRPVRIAAGNIVAGSGDELAVLDSSDLYVYDNSGTEPRLLNSLTVSIPQSSIRHREDAGSLEVIDLNGDGIDEVCIAPPGGNRGEIWQYDGDNWIPLGFLAQPARTSSESQGAVLIGEYLRTNAAFESGSLTWSFPLSERENISAGLNFSPIAIASLPMTGVSMPSLLAVNQYGSLFRVTTSGENESLPGKWGNCVKTANAGDKTVAILTSSSYTSDVLSIIDASDGTVLATYPYPDGPIIDIALGDTDHDGKSEIIVAAVHPEGVRIYY